MLKIVSFVKLTLCGLVFLSSGTLTYANAPSAVEVFAERVFVPSGYDDNDNIEIVIDGILPNLCYDVLPTEYTLDREHKKIYVHQPARKRDLPQCEKNSADSIETKLPMEYSSVLNIGQLDQGVYTVVYMKDLTHSGETILEVAHATSDKVDDALYAPVSSVFIPDMIVETNAAEAMLTGVLPSNCLSLREEDLIVRRTGNVIVILPILQVPRRGNCTYSPVALDVIAPLGKLEPGRYLLHVRKMVGRSVNKVFTVISKAQSPIMH